MHYLTIIRRININLFKFENIREIGTHQKYDLPVSAILNNGDIEVVSKYSDDIWNFKHLHKNVRTTSNKYTIIFSNTNIGEKKLIDYPFLCESIKNVLYNKLMSGIKISTLTGSYWRYTYFLNWLVSNKNIFKLSNINESILTEYMDFILSSSEKKTVTHTSKLLASLRDLYKYGKNMDNSLNFLPYKGIKIHIITLKKGNVVEDKQREIIPDELWKKITQVSEIQIDEFLLNLKKEKAINEFFINKMECYDGDLRRLLMNNKKEISSSIGESFNITDFRNLRHNTLISCCIIIQAYTGMRVSELMSLKRNCIIQEDVHFRDSDYKVMKIKGLTFKYEKQKGLNSESGSYAEWLCPNVAKKAIDTLEIITDWQHKVYSMPKFNELTGDKKTLLILNQYKSSVNATGIVDFSTNPYKKFLELKGVDVNINLTSHCFRRTLARYFAKSLIDIPVEALKSQFKHFSNDITYYYMREDNNVDNSLVELMESFSEAKINNKKEKTTQLSVLIEKNIDDIILTANNIDDLIDIVDGKQVKIINEYMSTIAENPESLSPIDCLTCDSVLIIPELHLDFWKEMLIMYNEMLEFEPDSIWYKQERLMIKNVVETLENGNIYTPRRITIRENI